MVIKIKTDTAPDERKKSTVRKNEPVEPVANGVPVAGRVETTDSAVDAKQPVDTPSRTFRTRAPNGSFDKLKYQREYHREYRRHQRAKKKAEQENASD